MANRFIPYLAVAAIAVLSSCGPQLSMADRCQSYGYQPGTQLFLDCLQTQEQARQAQMQAMAVWAHGVQQQQQQNYQQQMQFYSNAFQNTQRPNQSLNCTSFAMGNMLHTNCN